LAAGYKNICAAYLTAQQRWEDEGLKTVSTDEKTGIPALERNAPDLPVQAGHCRRQEYEYTRHGTQCLIANWDVPLGKIISHTISETRDEIDFQQHIERTVESAQQVKRWCFIVDNLNTHHSELLVWWVAGQVGTSDQELGVKGKWGILKNMKTRGCLFNSERSPRLFYLYAKAFLLAQSD